jgi:hypothetical protein
VQAAIEALTALHQQLAGALAAGDVAQVHALVTAREACLVQLARAWQAASAAEQGALQPVLAALQREESDLLQRCAGLRDELRAQLAAGPRHATAGARPVVSEFLDRQA